MLHILVLAWCWIPTFAVRAGAHSSREDIEVYESGSLRGHGPELEVDAGTVLDARWSAYAALSYRASSLELVADDGYHDHLRIRHGRLGVGVAYAPIPRLRVELALSRDWFLDQDYGPQDATNVVSVRVAGTLYRRGDVRLELSLGADVLDGYAWHVPLLAGVRWR